MIGRIVCEQFALQMPKLLLLLCEKVLIPRVTILNEIITFCDETDQQQGE
jgi:hypothetical protein